MHITLNYKIKAIKMNLNYKFLSLKLLNSLIYKDIKSDLVSRLGLRGFG